VDFIINSSESDCSFGLEKWCSSVAKNIYGVVIAKNIHSVVG
jgi:hypothetical protein